jgi:GDP-D-mannose 3', 5'-epimerase
MASTYGTALVAGGGGFIGGHLVADLLEQGFAVRSVDVKPQSEWYQVHREAENVVADLSLLDSARASVAGMGTVYMLAADMGGMGFIENNKAACMLSVLTSTHMLQASHEAEVGRYFYASRATCSSRSWRSRPARSRCRPRRCPTCAPAGRSSA